MWASEDSPYLPPHIPWRGNACRLLTDGVEAYPAMLSAISNARTSVLLETYIFRDDATGRQFAQAFGKATRRGVEVRLLYDALGSWGTRRAFFRQLKKAGVRVQTFKPFSLRGGLARLFRRDHRKLLLVDSQVAFVGGLNIADFWAPPSSGAHWRDDVLRIEGPAVVALERRFWASWRSQKRKVRRFNSPVAFSAPGGSTSLVVLSSRRAIYAAYLRALKNARNTVRIAAAYFVPDKRLVRAMLDAAARGVEVSLITAGNSDLPFMTWASRGFYHRLLRGGVRIFEWHSRVLHAKTAVVDAHWGTIGSFNLERTSLWLNHEVNVFFADGSLGKALDASLKRDLAESREIDMATWAKRPLRQRLLEWFLSLFQRVL